MLLAATVEYGPAALQYAVPVGSESPFWPHFASTWAKIRKRIAPVKL